MSSRRSSAIATAEASLQGSRSGSPIDIQGDRSMTDLTNIGNEEEVGSASTCSYIQRSPQLDIAFLHSISTHRPLGPHKHFNVIPVLITLDRTIRQIGARRRDASTSEPLEDVEEENSDEEESSNKRRRNDRSPSTSRKAIKKEDTDDDVLSDAAYTATSSAIPVDSEMVWQRLSELYDLEGLEELEDGAVDGEDDSPFYISPPPTYFSMATRNVLGEKIKSKPVFGFGSSLAKLPESATPAPTKSSGRQQKQSRSKAAQDEDEEDEEEHIADFELGPWEDYEDLIAPRRLKSYAPDEGPSESDEELSEPSIEQKVSIGTQDEDDDIEAKEEDEDQESEEDEGDEDEDEEEEDDDDEEEEKKPSRRKGASSSRRAPANSRRKSGTASATPTASNSASTRASRSSAKPRRSARR